MLEEALKAVIPREISTFPKLTEAGDHYFFDRWDRDRDTGAPLLRYSYWSPDRTRQYRKKILIPEVERLLHNTIGAGQIGRQDFRAYCPRTDADGPCGLAVIIATLEHLGIVRRTAWGEYTIVNTEKARRILEA
jgi:hypothetical protein